MKDYRNNEMKNLAIVLCFLFLIWCTSALDSITNIDGENQYAAFSSAIESIVISAIISSATILCDCLVSSKIKDCMVGLGFIPPAGETVFSRISEGRLKDNRFRLSDAAKQYSDIISELPCEKKQRHEYENKLWYGIYIRHQERGQVKQTQKDYLMCRDLYTETISFGLLYLLSILVFPETVDFSCKFFALFVALVLALNKCTHIKMNRFVNTVLAVDIGTAKSEKEGKK